MAVFSRTHTKWKIGVLIVEGVYVMKEGGEYQSMHIGKIFYFITLIILKKDTYIPNVLCDGQTIVE